MADQRTDFDALLPELRQWNDGDGISAQGWIGCMGSYPLAVGYSLLFWPRFVRFEHYVLRESFSESSLRGFEGQSGSSRASVEWVMNHIHLADIHYNAEPPTEAQLRYLGRLLGEIHAVKLGADFPDLRFEVEFNDEPGLDPIDYQLSFWQVEASP
jgi:hypothetical protein